MTSGQPKRKRGVVLTPTGRQKLQEAIKAWEEQDNFGDKLTIEELSDRESLDNGEFRTQGGGFDRLNKLFQGRLETILAEIGDRLWQEAG